MLIQRDLVIPSIVEEHFEELTAMCEMRESWVHSWERTPEDLAGLEARAEAHLDGLRIAGAYGIELAERQLNVGYNAEATAAVLVLLQEPSDAILEAVRVALLSPNDELRNGVRIGLRHVYVDALTSFLGDVLRRGPEPACAAALDVLAFHRIAPEVDVRALLVSPDAGIRLMSIAAAGRVPGLWTAADMWCAAEDEVPEVRRAALEASARAGESQVVAVCRELGWRIRSPVSEALAFLGIVGSEEDLKMLLHALKARVCPKAVLAALGAYGAVEAIPAILEALDEAALREAVASAFSRITGTSIPRESPSAPPENYDEAQEDIWEVPGAVSVDGIRAWWEAHGSRFHAGYRWQAGYPLSPSTLGEHFDRLPMAFRRDVFLRARSTHAAQAIDLELEGWVSTPGPVPRTYSTQQNELVGKT